MPKINYKPVIEDKKVVDRHLGHIILSNEERKKYTFKSPYPQEFSLPSNIIYYIARNPAFLKGHLKLISTCKFLLLLSRILLIENLRHNELKHCFYGDDCHNWLANNRVLINLKNQFFKFWIHDHLVIPTESLPNRASFLIKHCHKFSLREIHIHSQVLTFEELEFLVSGENLKEVFFVQNIIKNADGSVTEYEKVFELLCCKKFTISFPYEKHGICKNTTKKIIKILSSNQIPDEQKIGLWNTPQNLDFNSFSDFLKTNMTDRQHTIDLSFSKEISQAYKNQLQEFVDEIIQLRWIYAHTIPIICFPGENDEAYRQLYKMRGGHVEGILKKPST